MSSYKVMKLFFKKVNKLSRGFTLVETLVAISIFTVSVVALMSVLGQGISNTTYAKQKVIASYLAQEGIEYIRNMRDTYVLYSATSSAGWNAFNTKLTNASCQAGNGCYFNADNLFSLLPPMPMTQITFTPCGASCIPLSYDASTGKYGYSGTSSGFTRKIQIAQLSADQTKIYSTVFWIQGSGVYSVTFSENLFNWVQ